MLTEMILEKIKQYEYITIFRHVRPDGDAYGSQIGLKHLIRCNFPDKKVFCLGKKSPIFDRILDTMDEDVPDETIASSLAIILDTPNQGRIDDERYVKAREIVKIDHHILIENFGNIEWVDDNVIATSQLIAEFACQLDLKMNKEAAEALYLGLVTDSGRFLYRNVNERTFEIATYLVHFDVDLPRIYEILYTQTEREVRFKGYCQLNFKMTPHGVAYMKITKDIIEQFNITPSYAAGIVNVLSNIEECEIHVHFAEDYDGRIRIEFRSKRIPVNLVASKYGGGGHALASGTIVNSWEDVDAIINELDEICQRSDSSV